MCIAILNNKGKLTKETIYNCWDNNPDGAGFTYWNGSELVVIKELQSKKRFFKLYSQHRDKSNNPFAVLKASAIAAKQQAVFPNNFTNLPKVSPPFLPALEG